MVALKQSKSDELNPTQRFDGGYIMFPGYTTAERTAYTPASGDFPGVMDTDSGEAFIWNGTQWKQITNP